MGQSTKSTRPGLPHMGKPHNCVNLADSKHDSHGRITRAEPKLSPIRKRLILRALRHSKAYKYTLEEEERGTHREGVRNYSKEAD
ncbi:Transaldolase [Gossypium arboreum]|uniref:Transaldolase n=1 Tax=Gossypium arboreum TaxID=29729 RepID=A0A0B0MJ62_GOSAR|nr:Transaldolase [Gossypium arboreum]KHG29387.1 Transaldolase [Gossypium arboreum]